MEKIRKNLMPVQRAVPWSNHWTGGAANVFVCVLHLGETLLFSEKYHASYQRDDQKGRPDPDGHV